jgi:hypothetical protein
MIEAFVLWAVAKAVALASGIIVGAWLAIAIVNGGPGVWVELAQIEVNWILAIERGVAWQSACCIAVAGTILGNNRLATNDRLRLRGDFRIYLVSPVGLSSYCQ